MVQPKIIRILVKKQLMTRVVQEHVMMHLVGLIVVGTLEI